MHLAMLLEMAADGMGDRVALGPKDGGITFAELAARARRAGAWLAAQPGERVAFADVGSESVPLALFGSAIAGKPYVPLSYRLSDEQLRQVAGRTAPSTLLAGDDVAPRVGGLDGVIVVRRSELDLAAADESGEEGDAWSGDPESVAVLLFTSGTTGEPKAAVLRHKNLTAYVLGTVEFMGAGEDEAALVSVPPYHIAGISAALTNTYAGRRVVVLGSFDPKVWVETARREDITHAMVVPTMLGRILDVLDADGEGLPALRALSYGGGPMPVPVIERALELLPAVGFVNAYGLTETSSTIALLGPDDHRTAIASDDPAVRRRLGSVGQPLPGVEVSIRDADGAAVPPGAQGEIWVRGEQVSGEYTSLDRRVEGGWFPTRDGGEIDAEGFLYIHGRLDDVIVRGGENMSPGEIESVLLEHDGVESAAVVGIPDIEWGEAVAAAVVPREGASLTEADLQEFVRARLRSSKTPSRIDVVAELPYNETGKLLRRVLRDQLSRTR